MDPFWGQWWVWGVAAVALAVGEVLLPSYVLLGFGVGAGIVAILLLIGIPVASSLPVLLLVFALSSLVAWLLLRRFLGVYNGQVKTFDHDIND
jgi:membrane protein implicated in regulation of membrane protease activity